MRTWTYAVKTLKKTTNMIEFTSWKKRLNVKVEFVYVKSTKT